MDFKQITLSDVGALRPYLRAQYRSCDYSVLGVFMWADRFGYEYKTEDGVLFMRERSRHGGEYDYLLPLGEGSMLVTELLDALLELCPETTFTLENQQCAGSLSFLRENGYLEERK